VGTSCLSTTKCKYTWG